jgi:uncharacterized protein
MYIKYINVVDNDIIMSLEYWFMFPVAIIVATIAMSTLVGGATFFSPLFILILGLEPRIAIAVALMTQFFGFTTGLIRYIFQKSIDYSMGFFLLLITIPYAIIGSFILTKLDPYIIRVLLGIMIIYIGNNLLREGRISISVGGKNITSLHFKQHRIKSLIELNQKDLRMSVFTTAIGSLFLGMTSAGLGEMMGFNWIKKTTTQIKTIVATTVFIIAITTFITSASHFYTLFTTNMQGLILAKDILIFTVPGVMIGAIVGTHIIHRINQDILQRIISYILFITGFMCFIPF